MTIALVTAWSIIPPSPPGTGTPFTHTCAHPILLTPVHTLTHMDMVRTHACTHHADPCITHLTLLITLLVTYKYIAGHA